ncbi:MAG: ABC transporter permease [Patescibacteria group bacterium]|jgi:putative ABC transport system permease protein
MGKQTHHLRFVDVLRLSFRVFRTKPLRSSLTILGMSFGIGVVLILVSMGYGLQYILIGRLVTTEDSLISMEALYPPEAELTVTEDALQKIKQMDGVAEVSPVSEFSGSVESQEGSGLIITRIVDANYFRLSGQNVDFGKTFGDHEPKVILSRSALQLINGGDKVNETTDFTNHKIPLDLTVYYQGQGDDLTVTEVKPTETLFLSGVITDELQPPFAIIPASYLSTPPHFYNSLWVKAKNIDTVASLRDQLVKDGFFISAKVDLVQQATKAMQVITIILTVIGITALIVAAIGMLNTMLVSFLERIEEIGIIKSLGAVDRDVRKLFLMESVVMGFLGGVFGVLIGLGGGQIGNLSLAWLARHFGGKPVILFLTPTWFIVLVIVVSTTIGLLAGFWPAHRAAKLSPKEALNKH